MRPVADDPILSDAEVVAAMASYLIDAIDSNADAVLACPAIYSVEELSALREALDAVGLARIALTPEPIAAAAWLETQCEPEDSAAILVYDLGGSGLDITLLRTEPGGGARIVGRPLRSSALGGRAFSTLLAHYAHDRTADTTAPGLPSELPDAEVAGLRAGFVRSSVPLLHECIRVAGLAPADVDRILLVGGAARPVEVAQVLADELGCRVVTASDPAQCIATGAAVLAERGLGSAELLVPSRTGHPAKGLAALAGAAAVLATAGVVALYGANPAEPSGPPAQALDAREVVPLIPLIPYVPDRPGQSDGHAVRAGSDQPHTVRISTDYLVGYRNSTLQAEAALAAERPDAPHSTPKPDTTIVASSTGNTPPAPVRSDTSGTGGLRPGTGAGAEIPADLTIPTVGSSRPPQVPAAVDLATVRDALTPIDSTPIDSTANASARSRVSPVGEAASTPNAASGGAASGPATSTSHPSGGSAAGDTAGTPTRSTKAGTDPHTGAPSQPGRGAGNDSTTSASSRSDADAGPHSGANTSRQRDGRTGGDSGTNAGSDSAARTGSRAGA
ncbi:Hsp70 family protein [Nocardia sp. R6R-6]|uniref:Hsp70 family protein n=1 Tax=Nocardia sp. R6R-6 TaxID=3459303 RepID=UPI00403D8257